MKETNGMIQKDSNLLKKYLNDPDNKYFRTTPTRGIIMWLYQPTFTGNDQLPIINNRVWFKSKNS